MIEQPQPHGKEMEALEKSGEVVRRLRSVGHLMGRNQPLWDRLIDIAESRMDGFIYISDVPQLYIPENGDLKGVKRSGTEYKFQSPTTDKKYVYFALDERFISFRLGTFDIRKTEQGDKFSFSYIDLWTQANGEPMIQLDQENFIYGVKGTGEFIRIYISKDPIAIFDRSDTKTQVKKKIPVIEALSHYFEPDIREFSPLAKLLN